MRLSSDDWGDVCMIPTTLEKADYPTKLVSFGPVDELSESYIMRNNQAYEGQAYGIPSMGNVQGIVYNKQVFADAGITELPKTPDEFLDGCCSRLKIIQMLSRCTQNFAAVWTMGAWNAYISGSATGDPDFTNMGLTHGLNPFSKHDDMTGPLCSLLHTV